MEKITQFILNTGIAGTWFLFVTMNTFAQNGWEKIPTGTRYDITRLILFSDTTGVFLADRIYRIDRKQIRPMSLPGSSGFRCLSSFSSESFCFTKDTPFSGSRLFVYEKGVISEPENPFANQITAISMTGPQEGILSGFAETAVLKEGNLQTLPPYPSRSMCVKIAAFSTDRFYILTRNGEVFEYNHGKWKRRWPGIAFRDIAAGRQDTLAAVGNGVLLYEAGGTTKVVNTGSWLQDITCITVRHPILALAGAGGLIVRIEKNNPRITWIDRESLFLDVQITKEYKIAVAGNEGSLLLQKDGRTYKIHPPEMGFTRHKLLLIGADADDEYGNVISDFNGDGRPDIYTVCLNNPNRLYINYFNNDPFDYPEAYFQEKTQALNAGGQPGKTEKSPSPLQLGVVSADADNDGDQDLYICALNAPNQLLINNGKGRFIPVSHQKHRACGDHMRSHSAVFGDVDLDGDLDLFITSELASNRLYLNDGSGHFRDITLQAGLSTREGGMCASFADINHDGLPDLAVSFWNSGNKLYLNTTSDDQVSFRDITSFTSLNDAVPSRSNGLVFGDFDNDGNTDLLIVNRKAPNVLYRNPGNGYMNRYSVLGSEDSLLISNGVLAADFNLDGWQDLFLTNAGGNRMYRNDGGGKFTDVTQLWGIYSTGYGTGCSWGDVDHDGDPDLYASVFTQGSSVLYINRLEKGYSVKLKFRGTRSARDGTGVKVWLYRAKNGQLAGYREILSGGGYGSGNMKEALLGIHPEEFYRLHIKFPLSPDTLVLDSIQGSTTLEIWEETGWSAAITDTLRFLKSILADREMQLLFLRTLTTSLLLIVWIIMSAHHSPFIVRIRKLSFLFLMGIYLFSEIYWFYSPLSWRWFLPGAITLLFFTIIHLFTGRILLIKRAEDEKRILREKFSRDLHDDLASTLGTVSIYAESLVNPESLLTGRQKSLALKTATLARQAMLVLTDIIWMTTPREESLQGLILKIASLGQDLCSEQQIHFQTEWNNNHKEIQLNPGLRNNVYLILKEAIYNALKHARPAHLTFRTIITQKECIMDLEDDGTGFSGTPGKGNGINNMHSRARESNIQITFQSSPGKGTQLKLHFRI